MYLVINNSGKVSLVSQPPLFADEQALTADSFLKRTSKTSKIQIFICMNF